MITPQLPQEGVIDIATVDSLREVSEEFSSVVSRHPALVSANGGE
jgi:hypothetical protein